MAIQNGFATWSYWIFSTHHISLNSRMASNKIHVRLPFIEKSLLLRYIYLSQKAFIFTLTMAISHFYWHQTWSWINSYSIIDLYYFTFTATKDFVNIPVVSFGRHIMLVEEIEFAPLNRFSNLNPFILWSIMGFLLTDILAVLSDVDEIPLLVKR